MVTTQFLMNGTSRIRIRTWLQHTWATAVEAIGAYRGENMKAGEGSQDWLRLFALMSGEFAATEKCPEPPGIPARQERVKEIIALDKSDAANTLENVSHAVKYSENIDPKSSPEYYQIIYDRKNRVVDAKPYFNAITGAAAYDAAELSAEKSQSQITSVLVEADGIENLKAAYPELLWRRADVSHAAQEHHPRRSSGRVLNAAAHCPL